MGDSVSGEEEGVESWGEGKVGEGADVVVCEINGILILQKS